MNIKELLNKYDDFKEKSLKNRRFKHKDIIIPIKKRDKNIFEITLAGKSYSGKEIYLLKAGKGGKKVFFWSQMHGNESTGTAALFDLFNFFENPGELKQYSETILSDCTLYFIPMLNPDGAEEFKRRNAQDIDINRDALRLQTPEGKILMTLIDKIKPDFAFNLHDQDIWYSAGNSVNPAALSFLSPAFDFEKTVDESRKKSMRLIACINEEIQKIIPGKIGRYYDDFMPSAFGDNIQKKGAATILIESGGLKNDFEKQTVRKLNFAIYVYALCSVSKEKFKDKNVSEYEKIPFNLKNKLFDFVIRNAVISGKYGNFIADIGIRSKILKDKDIYEVSDAGDLSYYGAFNETDIKGKEISPVKTGDNANNLLEKFFGFNPETGSFD